VQRYNLNLLKRQDRANKDAYKTKLLPQLEEDNKKLASELETVREQLRQATAEHEQEKMQQQRESNEQRKENTRLHQEIVQLHSEIARKDEEIKILRSMTKNSPETSFEESLKRLHKDLKAWEGLDND